MPHDELDEMVHELYQQLQETLIITRLVLLKCNTNVM